MERKPGSRPDCRARTAGKALTRQLAAETAHRRLLLHSTDSPRAYAHLPLSHVLGSSVLLGLMLFTLVLSGCGPRSVASDRDALVEQAQAIALDYQADGDLAVARRKLESLAVANPSQWLLHLTETAITQTGQANVDPAATDALVALATDLELRSSTVQRYATDHLAPTASAPTTLPTARTGTEQPTLQAAAATDTSAAPVTPVVTAEPPTPTVPNSPAAAAEPAITTQGAMNVRGGPGTHYPVVASLAGGAQAQILAKNPAGDWWQISLGSGGRGWVYGPLVDASGDLTGVPVPADIPTPPPTATPAPTPIPQPTATPIPSGPDFRLVKRELWDVVRNGGRFDGPSVHCGEKRELHVTVLDAAGNRLNGVAVQAIYGNREIYVTGSQGKGDGQVEFVLGEGQGVTVVRDGDRQVSSDVADGMKTDPREIPFESLISGQYCTDDASCQHFVNQFGCFGHYSWSVVFQRSY